MSADTTWFVTGSVLVEKTVEVRAVTREEAGQVALAEQKLHHVKEVEHWNEYAERVRSES